MSWASQLGWGPASLGVKEFGFPTLLAEVSRAPQLYPGVRGREAVGGVEQIHKAGPALQQRFCGPNAAGASREKALGGQALRKGLGAEAGRT